MCKSRMKLAIITRNVLQGMCLYKLNETYCEFAGFFLLLFFVCVFFKLLGFLYYWKILYDAKLLLW